MASITIRDLDDALKARLRVRAAENGRSMEEEARAILRAALAAGSVRGTTLVAAIRSRIEPLGGIDLDLPPRAPMREPPRIDE